jgi:hypothetical protein
MDIEIEELSNNQYSVVFFSNGVTVGEFIITAPNINTAMDRAWNKIGENYECQ